jgi:hypothetical protein
MTEIRIIAHRGNIDGPSADENKPSHIIKALDSGFEVEIDVWYLNGDIWFGHDYPQYRMQQNEFNKIIPFSWLHCKNIEAVEYLSDHFMEPNYFWHESDTLTLTSHKYLWTYPGAGITSKSIAVMPETTHQEFYNIPFGICTDYAIAYRELLK